MAFTSRFPHPSLHPPLDPAHSLPLQEEQDDAGYGRAERCQGVAVVEDDSLWPRDKKEYAWGKRGVVPGS